MRQERKGWKRNWGLIIFLTLIIFTTLNSCGNNSSVSFAVPTPLQYPPFYSSELIEWLTACPANLPEAVTWWNEEERFSWSFVWPEEIEEESLNWIVGKKKINCYWWAFLFYAKFPESETIFIEQDGDYNHEVLRSGRPGSWTIYSCDPGKELFVDTYQLKASNEEEFWQEMGQYFLLGGAKAVNNAHYRHICKHK